MEPVGPDTWGLALAVRADEALELEAVAQAAEPSATATSNADPYRGFRRTVNIVMTSQRSAR